MNFEKIREKIAKLKGPKFWKGLDELAETEEFQQYVAEEFPHGAQNDSPANRRDFLKLMGASLLLASMPACGRQPSEKILPFVKAREDMIPGKPLFFATSMIFNGHATGLVVESHMGRPTKIEGNKLHPDSLGATHAIHQASVLGLYDPDRSKAAYHHGRISTWPSFVREIKNDLKNHEATQGEGLRILTESVVSPTLGDQLRRFLKKYPKAKWHQYEPLANDLARQAQKAAFEKWVDPIYDFEKAEVVLSLGSDFLVDEPGSLRYARQFMKKRKVHKTNSKMNRLYVMEPTPSLTGASADHLLARKTGRMEDLVVLLAKEVGVSIEGSAATPTAEEQKWIRASAADLKQNRGQSLVIAGPQMPASIQALTHSMNIVLGNTQVSVDYLSPIEQAPVAQLESLKELVRDMGQGNVSTLILLGGNPVYNAPADLNFKNALLKVNKRVHLSLYTDETSVHCNWHIPRTHFLETFSDGRATDGTVSFAQPLIAPLYGGKSDHDIMNVLLGQSGLSDLQTLKNYWQGKLQGLDFEKAFRKAVHDGVVPGTKAKVLGAKAKTKWNATELKALQTPKVLNAPFEVTFRQDASVWDGRFANNGWLQELPKPMTKLTWDNAALISPKTAEKLKVSNEDVITVTLKNKTLSLPVWIVPGHAEDTVSLSLGYGRTKSGQIGTGQGFNTYKLRQSSHLFAAGAAITKKGSKYALASTQIHHSMHGRDLIRTATLEEYQKHPDFAQGMHHGDSKAPTSFYGPHPSKDYAWGMAINLNACMGCNACVIACQSENNTPIVGKEEVQKGREMHWIRIDHYYEGSLDKPEMHQQPVMCMHCENAPCEPVCPVGATSHSDEGLNEMTYNRCVGTRYCANNCPYKVRRFNFFEYADKNTESIKLMRNPDVTVRNRGVMEKCTFCVQRINEARITAEKEGRKIRDGEVKTACQTACPTEAIDFGNLLDPDSKVSKEKHVPLNYGILTELNTHPRLTYLAKVKNPNPALVVK